METNYIKSQIKANRKELIELLQYVNDNVPFYNEFLLDINDWESIPFINKKIIQENSEHFISGLKDNSYILNTHTSGSTGNCLTLVKDVRLERVRNLELWKRRNKIVKGLSSKKLLYFYRTLESNKLNAYIYMVKQNILIYQRVFMILRFSQF